RRWHAWCISIPVLWGSIVRAFLSLGQGEPLPRSGIAREINLLSCASCLSSRTNSRALGRFCTRRGRHDAIARYPCYSLFFRDCSIATGADSKIARPEQEE